MKYLALTIAWLSLICIKIIQVSARFQCLLVFLPKNLIRSINPAISYFIWGGKIPSIR